jgi:hypothetical protein
MSTIGLTELSLPKDFEDLFGPEIIDDASLIGKTKDEKLKILRKRKLILSKIANKLQNFVDDINLRIENLESPK